LRCVLLERAIFRAIHPFALRTAPVLDDIPKIEIFIHILPCRLLVASACHVRVVVSMMAWGIAWAPVIVSSWAFANSGDTNFFMMHTPLNND